jgi:hypothetical protein
MTAKSAVAIAEMSAYQLTARQNAPADLIPSFKMKMDAQIVNAILLAHHVIKENVTKLVTVHSRSFVVTLDVMSAYVNLLATNQVDVLLAVSVNVNPRLMFN